MYCYKGKLGKIFYGNLTYLTAGVNVYQKTFYLFATRYCTFVPFIIVVLRFTCLHHQ